MDASAGLFGRGASATRRSVTAGLAASLASALSGCWLLYPAHSFRFRITVDVDTPAGRRSGSGVMEVAFRDQLKVGGAGGGAGWFIGEAVQVELPSGILFLLVRDYRNYSVSDAAWRAFVPFDQDIVNRGPKVDYFGSRKAVGLSAELARENWPMFVRFPRITDQNSVEIVDPEHVPTTAGEGRVARVTATITRDEITEGVFKTLPWLPPSRDGRRLKAQVYSNNDPSPVQMVESTDFFEGTKP